MRETGLKLFTAAVILVRSSALAEVHYVDINSTNATPPYTNWATAATNIQDAVDAAVAGDEIVVANGIYATGGRTNYIAAPNFSDGNRVVVDKPLSLRSANGPQSTIIDGGHMLRCVCLTNNAALSGFTLINGVSPINPGGGIWCASSNTVVTDCLISSNKAVTFYGDNCGGGAYGGTLINCTLTDNEVRYVRSDFNAVPVLTAYGGGAAYCTLNRCSLSRNAVTFTSSFYNGAVAQARGGGGYFCTLNNCTLIGNSVSAFLAFDSSSAFRVWGGGADFCTLNNCTLAGNSAAGGGGCPLGGCREIFGGGTSASGLNNCISFGNTQQSICEDCGSDPLFVDTNTWSNLRLQSNSPCINAGNNSYVTSATDLDGNPRIAGGTVDMGAYEFQSPASMISYAWLQQYSLPINSSTDTADPDGDAVDNYHEWLAGTDPTNPRSSPAQLTITSSGVPPSTIILAWSTNAVGFTLQSTTNLVPPVVWRTNSSAPLIIDGQNVLTNPTTLAQQFYRLVH